MLPANEYLYSSFALTSAIGSGIRHTPMQHLVALNQSPGSCLTGDRIGVMMISTSSKYALRALTVLAASTCPGFVPVEFLARKASVPGPYLSKLVKTLSLKGIVVTKRGIRGGVRLENKSISFHDICAALNEPALLSNNYLVSSNCDFAGPAQFDQLWNNLRRDFLEGLKKTKLMVVSAPLVNNNNLVPGRCQPGSEKA